MCRIRRIGLRGIFQLTSSQGGWRYCFSLLLWKQLFNSHPHKEDDWSSFSFNDGLIFSTHILTRRMTSPFVYMQLLEPFQLTSSQGGWPPTAWGIVCSSFFNSHPHKEDDELYHFYLQDYLFFQLTSSQGGWRWFDDECIHSCSFQLTSSQGGWLCLWEKLWQDLFFNSHPHKEDDLAGYENEMRSLIFQLTSSQGGWPYSLY